MLCERPWASAELLGVTLAVLVVMLQARGAGAQTNTAEIAGLVHDAQGALGAHTVTAVLAGFTRTRRADIVAALRDRLQLDFLLELAGLNESASVFGNAQLLQVTSAEISDVVSNEPVLRMPLNARDVIGLSRAATGDQMGRVQRAQSRELRPAEPHLRHAELRAHLQREERA